MIAASALQLCALDLVLASYQDPIKAYEALYFFQETLSPSYGTLRIARTHERHSIMLSDIADDETRARIALEVYKQVRLKSAAQGSAAPLHDALVDFTQKRFDRAYRGFASLKQSRSDDTNVLFYYARSAFEMGKLDEAAAQFEAMLHRDPSNQRVMLELARSYYLMGDYIRSATLFDRVLDGELPDAVRANILRYQEQMRPTKSNHRLHALLLLGVGHDDNVYNHTYLSSTPYGDLTLHNDTDAKSDGFHRQSARIAHDYRFEQSALFWSGTLNAYNQSHFEHDDMDIALLGLEGAPGYRHNALTLALGLEAQQLWLGGEAYMNLYALAPRGEWMIDKSRFLTVQLYLQERRYLKEGESDRDARIADLTLSTTALRDNGDLYTLSLFGAAQREQKRRRIDISRDIFGAEGFYRFKADTSWYLDTRCRYAAHRYLERDPNLERRLDHYLSAQATLGTQLSQSWAFELAYAHMRNHSNIELYTYNKNRLYANLLWTY